MSYTNVFGGQTIYPAMLSLRQIALSANIALEWPTETATTAQVVAYIMQVTPAAGSLEIAMPPADQTANGQSVLFTNEAADTYTVTDTSGNAILTVATGEAWDLWLVDNSTENGTWNSAQRGATTGSVNVAALAGKGLKAITTTLNTNQPVTIISTNYAAGASDRAETFIWDSGAGDFDLDDASTVGDGWYVNLRNGGDGALTVTPASGTINGASDLTLQPADSCVIVTDGSNYYTYGLGVQATFAFDFVSIDIAGSGNYTLSGAELNRIAYQFTGLLTGSRDIIVPSTTQQYWVTNDTTGAYVLGVRTSTQSTPGIVVDQGESSIMYCNGTDVVDGDTQGISLPVAVAQGGTGATTASGARTNLGGTSVGVAVFTAADTAAGRTALALGTMSTQDATAVAITGGTISNVTTITVGTPTGGTLSSGQLNAEGLYVQGENAGPGKQMIPVRSSAMSPTVTDGAQRAINETATNDVNYMTLNFDQTTTEYAFFELPMPSSWNESTVTFRSVWTALSGTGTASFALQGVALSNDDALDTAYGTAVVVTDTLIATGDIHRSDESTAITLAGTPATSDTVMFRIYRDTSDTLNADAMLIAIELYITTVSSVDS